MKKSLPHNQSEPVFPMRINKYLAWKKIASRREADALVERGQILVKGEKAKLGDRVQESDQVEVIGKRKKLVYYAFNKPEGIITHSPQKGEKSIADILDIFEDVYPVGRLDKDSHGLILLTNDGRLTGSLLEPDKNHEKEYRVKTDKAIDRVFVERLSHGVKLDDGTTTKPCIVEQTGPKNCTIILTEGKKRQIRRMCESQSRRVMDLERVRIANIRLHHLLPGHFRKIVGEELKQFLESVGLV